MIAIQDRFPHFKRPVTFLKYYLSKQYVKLYPQDMFVAVCGSLGKTTTVRLSQAVLSQKYKTITTEANKDSVTNIPQTLLKLNPSFQKAVLEMGADSAGEADFYHSLVKPKVVILTRIISEQAEISKLLSFLPNDGIVILNWDDINSKKLAQQVPSQVVYYGTDPQNCTVWAANVRIENFRTNFELNLGVERVKVELPALGLHQIYPALAAAGLGVIHGIPLTKIKIALESVEPEDHKFQLLLGPNGSYILDDTFSATPIEVESAIDTLVQIPARRRMLVLGEMIDPNYSADEYRKIAEKIYKEKLDFIFLGQGSIKVIAEELTSLGFWEERVESNMLNSQLVSKLLKILGKGDVCLIKCSRSVRLDEVVKRIARKN
ncbi:hypothetical protein HYS96_04760 [Candidatus Daviesbacteria bacterium]|nr:hypothetical protein [Candidatus Daviesbacteria bacterium]